MKNFLKKNTGVIVFMIAVIVFAGFFAHVISVGTEYSDGLIEKAKSRAEFYSTEQARYIEEQSRSIVLKADYYAAELSACESQESFDVTIKNVKLSSISRDEALVDVLYSKNGILIDWSGNLVPDYAALEPLKKGAGGKLSTIFQYNNSVMSVGVSSPSTDSEFFDSVILVYDRAVLSITGFAYLGNDELVECVAKSEFTLLVKSDGVIVDRVENTKTFSVGTEPVQKGLIPSVFSNTATASAAQEALLSGQTKSFATSKGGNDYIFTIKSFGEDYGYISLVSAYEVKNVYGDGYNEMVSIWSTLLGLSVVLLIMLATMIITRIASKRKIYAMQMVDSAFDCATPKRFEKTAEEIIKRNKKTGIAFVSLKINNFGYVAERFGDAVSTDLGKFTVNEIHRGLLYGETFAYAGDGEFLLLLRYAEREGLTERLNGVFLRLSSFQGIPDENYKITVSFSVYEKDPDEKQNVKAMLSKLSIVSAAAVVKKGSFSISFYEDVLRDNYLKRAEIEGRMEAALKGNEFHLFYQPKYNLRAKNMDGSEILIRWFDPEIGKYRVPSEFLPVFEENGFINKLDRFVFFKACQNISERIAQTKICYPVSVNVSRVTAIQPDFTDYYIRIKNKFGIKDGFITIEFTESFAYENYEYLSKIVETLHNNGFLCSIDDFGTGYSSYNILKTISMDEIKLDKFFLNKGVSEERDKTLLKSVIDMVKELGMKVTQEGVETREDLYRIEKLGCDVIQGYYFAKPMKYVDYCEFIDTNFAK